MAYATNQQNQTRNPDYLHNKMQQRSQLEYRNPHLTQSITKLNHKTKPKIYAEVQSLVATNELY